MFVKLPCDCAPELATGTADLSPRGQCEVPWSGQERLANSSILGCNSHMGKRFKERFHPVLKGLREGAQLGKMAVKAPKA